MPPPKRPAQSTLPPQRQGAQAAAAVAATQGRANGVAAGSMSMTEREAAPISEPPEKLLKQIAPQRRMHPLAYALIAMSAVFGGVSAVMLLSPPPASQPVIVMVPNLGLTATPDSTAKAAAATTGGAVGEDLQSDAGAGATPGARQGQGAPGVVPVKASGDPKSAPSSAATADIDMSGFGNKGAPSSHERWTAPSARPAATTPAVMRRNCVPWRANHAT